MEYLTVNEYLLKLKIARIKKGFKILAISFLLALTIWVYFICVSSGNDTKKLNACLQSNTLDYCNKEVK